MKIHIDFKKDEAEAYKNFEKMFKPDEIDSVQFSKAIFLAGISAMQQEVVRAAQEAAAASMKEKEENQDDITISEDTINND